MKKIIPFLFALLISGSAYADTTTTHYSFVEPTNGGSTNTWGPKLNTNFASLDSVIWSASQGTTIGVNSQSSATSITLTNPLNNIQSITYTATSQNLILPAMNASTSMVVGGTIRITNAGSNAFGILAQDASTSVVTSLLAGQTVSLTLTANGTANGTFLVSGPYLTNTGNINVSGSVTANSFIPNGTSVPLNGLYLPTANTPTISADNSPIASFYGVASAVNYLEFLNNITGNGVSVEAVGSDSNIQMNLNSKGNSGVALTTGGGTQFFVPDTASSVDKWSVTGSAAGNPGVITATATGSDTNISINLVPKGNGIFEVGGNPISSPSIKGAFKNLKIVWASNTTLTMTADQIILQNSSNNGYLDNSVNVTCTTSTSGAGGLDTGSLAPSTWYYVYDIYNGSGDACLFSLSATSPTLPSGYTYWAREGSFYSDGSSNIRGFQQKGRRVQYIVGDNLSALPNIAGSSSSQGSTSTPTFITEAIGTFVPSTASQIKVVVSTNGSASISAIVSPNSNYGPLNSTTNPPLMGGVSNGVELYGDILLESTNLYWAQSGNGYLWAAGYEDNL